MGAQQGRTRRVRRVRLPRLCTAASEPTCLHRTPMKIIEITNVDFSLRHFLLPLMRAIRDRGHEVVGACAEGPLLADVRAEGFRVIPIPFVRRLSPLAHLRAFRSLVAILRAEKPDLVHAHMPISGFLARLAARIAGVPKVAYTCHGFLFNHVASSLPRRILSFVMEWIAARVTDVFLTVSRGRGRDARRLHIAAHAEAVRNGRDPTVFRPDPDRPRADPGGTGRSARPRSSLSPSPAWSGTRAIRNSPRRCDRCRKPNSGWSANGWPATGARTWRRCCAPPASATACACLATAPTSRPCWPPPTSSPCRAASRACRCRSSRRC